MMADVRFEFDDGFSANHGDAEMLHGYFQTCKQTLHFAGDAISVGGGQAKDHGVASDSKAIDDPPEHHQGKKNHGGCGGGHREETTTNGHADSSLHKNGGGGGHAHDSCRVSKNGAGAQEADSLNNVGGDARPAG